MEFSISGMDSLIKMIEGLEEDLSAIANLPQEPEFVEMLTDVAVDNYIDIFESKGSAIGESWNGNTLVKTGALKRSLTNQSAINVVIQGDLITFGSNVSYAPYVNDMYSFVGITQSAADQGAEVVGKWLVENGKLRWK